MLRKRPAAIVTSLLAVFLISFPAAAQSPTGDIVGTVTDDKGDPLPFATVRIKALGLNVITSEAGRFQMSDVPAGAHTLTFDHIGAQTKDISGVVVEAGRTKRVDAVLQEAIAAELDEFELTGKRIDELKKEASTTIRTIDTRETTKIRAINTTEEAIRTQAGVVSLGDDFMVRGGRSSEVKTVVDGMPVSDAFAGASGSGTMDISLMSQESLNLLTGGFDAEYGNAQSGIIEIATREGGEEYSGQLKFITDDFGAPDKTYFNYDNVAVGFGGPIPFTNDALRFYASAEGVFEDTYLKTVEERPSSNIVLNNSKLASYRDRQENATRGQGKVTWRLGGAKKLSGEVLYSRSMNDWYHHAFSRIGFWSEIREHWWFERPNLDVRDENGRPLPDTTYTYYNGPAHLSQRTNRSDQYKFVYTHPLTQDSFFTFRGAVFRSRYEEVVDNQQPGEYVPFTGDDTERDPENLFFAVTGDYPWWEQRESRQYTVRGDYQNKLGSGTHELRTGFTFDYFDLRKDARNSPEEGNDEGDFPNQYHENAYGGVLYVQDRLRYKKSMVMNVGLRFDFFDPGESAIRISNQRVLALEKPTTGMSFLERWKAQVSPRLGMSYPISDRDVLHFHYGRFFQLPDLEYLYDYSNEAIVGNRQVGNAFLEPETTISYEFGVRRQLSERIYVDGTVFFKDIFGLVGTEALEAENETEENPFAPTSYVNKDYGSVRGFELSLDKKFASYWQGGVSYTLSRATGSSSDVNQGQVVQAEGLDREPIREVPLSWDRTHVVNAHVHFSDPGVWGLNFDFSVASGAPATPKRLGQRTTRAEDINTIRLPRTMNLNFRGNKQYSLYGQEFRLFLEGRNVLDRRNVATHFPDLWPRPDHEYYREYYTEFGELGGAYNLKDTIAAPEDILVPLNDPRVYSQPRVFRVGIQYEW
jgi:outer membrane receptor protein involved in Fe transport